MLFPVDTATYSDKDIEIGNEELGNLVRCNMTKVFMSCTSIESASRDTMKGTVTTIELGDAPHSIRSSWLEVTLPRLYGSVSKPFVPVVTRTV